MKRLLPGVVAVVAIVALLPASCTTKEPESTTYFDRTISPILTTSCVRTNTGAGCHVADAKGNALGNLDVSSFKGVAKRRDLLIDYGAYGQPAFLLKNIDPLQVDVQTYDGKKVVVTTDIKHAGGSIFDPTASGYATLRRWIAAGATENNTGQPPVSIARQPCNPFVPTRPGFDLTKDPSRGDFAQFTSNVNPLITGKQGEGAGGSSCAAGNCHGTFANSLYYTCGDTPEQIRWNYLASEEYLAQTPEQSELLRRPLASTAGGAYHEGGVIFASQSDSSYTTLSEWAKAHGPPVVDIDNPGFLFFSQKVQPLLVKKGCMMVQCHSAAMFHDYRLRGGSAGSFSLSATRKNYELSLAQLAVDSDDPNASRLIRKNLYRPEVCGVAGCDKASGIVHRGGPLLEDFPGQTANAKVCADANHDYDNGDVDKIPAYCVFAEWLKRERAVSQLAPLSAIVYVRRPVGTVTRPQDFDTYSPGADLRRATVSQAAGVVTPVGVEKSLTVGCGLAVATADIRRPQVSWDGTKVAFAARSSASEPLAVYEMNADGSACAKHPEINAHAPSENGLLIHDFDPTYAPPENGQSRIVFTSTRGNLQPEAYDYKGPQRTPADPSKPNANLYSWELAPGGGRRVRQLTFLLNMERTPSFMSDGRLIFTAEKRAPNFSQLAFRRLNLDGGDYHPLYAQRGSIGYPEGSEIVELADKNFAAILRMPSTPHGGGALAVVNRSIGIDFRSTDPGDYPVDPGVLDPAAPQSLDPAFFLRSLRLPDGASNARPGQPTSGLYTAPSALPDALILVSFGEAADAAAFGGDYDVYVMSPTTGAKTRLLGEPGAADVDAVGVYARLQRPVFRSTLDEPNGHTAILPDHREAEVSVVDMPVLASLLFQNTPTGRLIDPDLDAFTVFEDMPPPLEVDSFDKGGANVVSDAFGRVYVRRRKLGRVPLERDGSAKFSLPGGLPIVLNLPDTKLSRERALPRYQRESMVFFPGEYSHQSFKAEFFDALCGQCHGAISGTPTDVALEPDFVTQASTTLARDKAPFVLDKPPGERGAIEGPPPTP